MSKRRVIAIFIIIAASVAIAMVPSVLQFMAENAVIRLKERGVRLQAQGITGFLIGVSATTVQGWTEIPIPSALVNSLPVQLMAEDAVVSLRPRLNPFRTSAKLTASAYGGIIDATLTNLFATQLISAHIQHLDVGLHPQLRALGVERGEVDLSATDHPLNSIWQTESKYTLDIKNFDLLPPSTVQQLTGVLRLQDGQAALRATIMKGGALRIDSGTFDSSLASGTLLGSAAMITPGGELTNINGSLRINLDRKLSAKLSPWLPILTNQAVSSESKSFVCNFRSANCSSSGTIRVGAGCIRSSCAGYKEPNL